MTYRQNQMSQQAQLPPAPQQADLQLPALEQGDIRIVHPVPVAVAQPVPSGIEGDAGDMMEVDNGSEAAGAEDVSTNLKIEAESELESLAYDKSMDTFMAVATISAPAYEPEGDVRVGMDIVAVLDRSGSMGGEKMKTLHRTVRVMIEQLKPCDRLSLVAYDDRVERSLDLINMDAEGKKIALAALKTIQDRGCTNLSGGLLEGLSVLEERKGQKNEVSSVLLMTDGLANAGITDPAQLVNITQAKIKSLQNPTTIYTFGYGSDHNSDLLNGLAKAGGGSYYFMRTPEAIPEAFADCMGGLMSVMAQNIKVEVEVVNPASGVRINEVMTSFDTKEDVPGLKTTIIIGDIFSEEQKDLLLDLKLPAAQQQMESQQLLKLTMRYFNVVAACNVEVQGLAVVRRTKKGSEDGDKSEKVLEQRSRIEATRAMEEAERLADQGFYQRANARLDFAQQEIRIRSDGGAREWSRGYVDDLLSCQKDMSSAQQYRRVGKMKLASKARKHGMQRANHCDREEELVSPFASNMYMSSAKANRKSAWRN